MGHVLFSPFKFIIGREQLGWRWAGGCNARFQRKGIGSMLIEEDTEEQGRKDTVFIAVRACGVLSNSGIGRICFHCPALM